jgi:hypothetical protein
MAPFRCPYLERITVPCAVEQLSSFHTVIWSSVDDNEIIESRSGLSDTRFSEPTRLRELNVFHGSTDITIIEVPGSVKTVS